MSHRGFATLAGEWAKFYQLLAYQFDGGMTVGQVIGSTDKLGGSAASRPVHYQDVMATLYHNLGINARRVTITDPTGRPQYLLDGGELIRELV